MWEFSNVEHLGTTGIHGLAGVHTNSEGPKLLQPIIQNLHDPKGNFAIVVQGGNLTLIPRLGRV